MTSTYTHTPTFCTNWSLWIVFQGSPQNVVLKCIYCYNAECNGIHSAYAHTTLYSIWWVYLSVKFVFNLNQIHHLILLLKLQSWKSVWLKQRKSLTRLLVDVYRSNFCRTFPKRFWQQARISMKKKTNEGWISFGTLHQEQNHTRTHSIISRTETSSAAISTGGTHLAHHNTLDLTREAWPPPLVLIWCLENLISVISLFTGVCCILVDKCFLNLESILLAFDVAFLAWVKEDVILVGCPEAHF